MQTPSAPRENTRQFVWKILEVDEERVLRVWVVNDALNGTVKLSPASVGLTK